MRVRQFKIRVNQASFIKYFLKDWNSDWFSSKKTLFRNCLHAELHLCETNQRLSDRANIQYGNFHISFLNNFARVEYFSFTYLRKLLPAKQKRDYELWTLSLHYTFRRNRKKTYFPRFYRNTQTKVLSTTINISAPQLTQDILDNILKFHFRWRTRCYLIRFWKAVYWNRWKYKENMYRNVKSYFHRYEPVEVKRIVYNKGRRFYFHPFYKYYYFKYNTYRFNTLAAYTKPRILLYYNIKNKNFRKNTLRSYSVLNYNNKKSFNKATKTLYNPRYKKKSFPLKYKKGIKRNRWRRKSYKYITKSRRIFRVQLLASNYKKGRSAYKKKINSNKSFPKKKIFITKYKNKLLISKYLKKRKLNKLEYLITGNSLLYWVHYKAKVEKVHYLRKKKHHKLKKIYKKVKFYKIYNKVYYTNKITKYSYKSKSIIGTNKTFFTIKNYGRLAAKDLGLRWLPQKYWAEFLAKKSVRRFILTNLFQFKIGISLNLDNMVISGIHNISLTKSYINFNIYYASALYTYYYIKGYNQITRSFTLNRLKIPYLFFDYNLKQLNEFSYFRMKVVGLAFFRAIKLWRAKKNSHYLGSFDLILTIILNPDFSKFGAYFIATYFNLQLQKIPNKKMQKWFIGACNEFFKKILVLTKIPNIKKLQFINTEGIQIDFKGRAVNMRRVFVKRKKFGHTYNTSYGYFDISKSYYFDYFTTKWGSTSVRISYFFNSYFHNRQSNFLINQSRRQKFNNKVFYKKLIYDPDNITFQYFGNKVDFGNLYFKYTYWLKLLENKDRLGSFNRYNKFIYYLRTRGRVFKKWQVRWRSRRKNRRIFFYDDIKYNYRTKKRKIIIPIRLYRQKGLHYKKGWYRYKNILKPFRKMHQNSQKLLIIYRKMLQKKHHHTTRYKKFYQKNNNKRRKFQKKRYHRQ